MTVTFVSCSLFADDEFQSLQELRARKVIVVSTWLLIVNYCSIERLPIGWSVKILPVNSWSSSRTYNPLTAQRTCTIDVLHWQRNTLPSGQWNKW